MRQQLIDHVVHQTQIAGHISGRDVGRRLATTALMVIVCASGGFVAQGIIIGTVIVLLELLAYPLNKRAGKFDRPISTRTAIWVFVVNWSAMLPFLAFAITLSYSDSLPYVLAGYLWAFGIFVHVSNTFGLLPFYNWSQMTPAFGAIFWMFWNLSQNPSHTAPSVHWFMTIGILLTYIVNTFDTMNRQKDTHQALERARSEANARLMELERLSRHDTLTNLMNRRAFDEIVASLLMKLSPVSCISTPID